MPTINNPENRPVVYGTDATDDISVAIDYTEYYERIATALETIATNSATIASSISSIETDIDIMTDNSTTIKDKQTTIADKQTAMETYQKKLKELGEDRGIHVVGPYEWLGLLSIYRLLIEQGKILDETENVDQTKVAESLQAVTQYLNKINGLPRQF